MIDGAEINAIRTLMREKSLIWKDWRGLPAEAGYELERTEGFGMAKRKEKRANR